MKSYEELRNEFLEEVSKIDVSELSLGGFGNSYREYAQLLQEIHKLPEGRYGFDQTVCFPFGIKTPKVESEGK